MLVGSFQIEICRYLQIITCFQYSGMGHTRVKPHIQGICHLIVVFSSGAKQFSGLEGKPGIYTFLLDSFGHGLD